MIENKLTINVPQGVEFIGNWVDANGRNELDRFMQGRVIINKQMTGCGITTYFLLCPYNVILVSPRLRLIQNKMEQFNSEEELCFYFNREKNANGKQQKSVGQLEDELTLYYNDCRQRNRPLKLLVTYDSFGKLADTLENDFQSDISKEFCIAIDESHCLIKDVKLKEYSNRSILSVFVQRLFNYENLVFVSATPIVQYVEKIPEFRDNAVNYLVLNWSSAEEVQSRKYGCKSALSAFDTIYHTYESQVDFNGRHYFDAIHLGEVSYYSTEAVVFLNSVQEIRKILNKYINKKGLIRASDVTVICADNPENESLLKKTNSLLSVAKSIPKEGEIHTTWTFVTRTAFEGVDFYSECASTYVIANYHVESLSLDIASDIPQIVGRQRRKDNLFRNTIHIFYTNNLSMADETEYAAFRQKKMEDSKRQISIWQTALPECKDNALNNLSEKIERNPNELYLTTVNGVPQINELIMLSEDYCWDIIRNHQSWFIMQREVGGLYSPVVSELKEKLLACDGGKTTMLRLTYGYLARFHEEQHSIFRMLRAEGYDVVAYYFTMMRPERVAANGFNSSKCDAEIRYSSQCNDIASLVSVNFVHGQTYSLSEAKSMLQAIYDEVGVNARAKATDLQKYARVAQVKNHGQRGVRIV